MERQLVIKTNKTDYQRKTQSSPDSSLPTRKIAHPILQLHKTIGNRAVERLFKSGLLQAKLKIGQPGDIYEQEADRIAEHIMRMPEPEVDLKPTWPYAKAPSCREEKIIQPKSIAQQITPLFQGRVDEEEKKDKEEVFQIKEAPDQEGAEERITFVSAGGRLRYGNTEWLPKKSAIFPKLEIKWTRSGKDWTAEVKPTTAAMGPVKMTFLPPGTYEVPGKKVTANFPQCGPKGKKVPFFTRVDAVMSNLAKLAEEEHRSDYQRAYDLTLKKCADQINAIAGQTFGPDTKAKVEQEIVKQIGGKKPSQWVVKELNRLTALSLQRDIQGWHRLIEEGEPVTCPPDCSRVEGITVEAATTRIPGPPSSDLIK